MTQTAFENVAAVAGQRVRRVQPCHRCGTLALVTATWAVPLDEGGAESDWNVNLLCPECRDLRSAETQAGRSLNDAWRRRRRSQKSYNTKFVYVIDGRAFSKQDDAAEFFDVSVATICRWMNHGTHGARKVER